MFLKNIKCLETESQEEHRRNYYCENKEAKAKMEEIRSGARS